MLSFADGGSTEAQSRSHCLVPSECRRRNQAVGTCRRSPSCTWRSRLHISRLVYPGVAPGRFGGTTGVKPGRAPLAKSRCLRTAVHDQTGLVQGCAPRRWSRLRPSSSKGLSLDSTIVMAAPRRYMNHGPPAPRQICRGGWTTASYGCRGSRIGRAPLVAVQRQRFELDAHEFSLQAVRRLGRGRRSRPRLMDRMPKGVPDTPTGQPISALHPWFRHVQDGEPLGDAPAGIQQADEIERLFHDGRASGAMRAIGLP